MVNDYMYVARSSTASFFFLFPHSFTRWQADDRGTPCRGLDLAVGSILRLCVLRPKDTCTEGSNRQSCDQQMTHSTCWATTALVIFLCVIEGGVCTRGWRDKGVWSTVGSKSRGMFMHGVFLSFCVSLWLLHSFLGVCACVCVLVGSTVQGFVLMLKLVIKNWIALKDTVESLTEPARIDRALVNGHFPYLLGWRALGNTLVWCV